MASVASTRRSSISPMRVGTGLYAQVVDVLGREIVNGDIPPGTIVYADQLCDRLGVSRSVIREGVRTLSSMGLVEARPQVGTRVLARTHWDLLNPYVVRWRSEGTEYLSQMKELLELRLGIEHAAAGFAVDRMTDEETALILQCANEMETAFHDRDARLFFDRDAEFHRLLLEGTGNVVIAQLADTISATLDARGNDTRPGMLEITGTSVKNHVSLATAIVERNRAKAQTAALNLVELTLREFQSVHTTDL